MRQLNLFPPDIALQDGRIHGALPENTPIIVSNGVGVDSVALLIELRRLNIVPDAIITALVGRELDWDDERVREEVQALQVFFRRKGARRHFGPASRALAS